MSRRYLFLMLGIPGSGKSTFSRQLAEHEGFIYFNSDRFREAIFKDKTAQSYRRAGHAMVFGAMREATHQALRVHSVVWDVNNNSYASRQQTARLATEVGAKTGGGICTNKLGYGRAAYRNARSYRSPQCGSVKTHHRAYGTPT